MERNFFPLSRSQRPHVVKNLIYKNKTKHRTHPVNNVDVHVRKAARQSELGKQGFAVLLSVLGTFVLSFFLLSPQTST